MFRRSLILILLAATTVIAQSDTTGGLPTAPADWGSIRVRSSLSKQSVPLNDTVLCIVTVEYAGDVRSFEIGNVDRLPATNLDIVSNSSANRVENRGGVQVSITEYTFWLVPKELGMGYVDPIPIMVTYRPTGERRTQATGRLSAKITDPVFHSSSPVWIWALIVVVLGAGGFSFWRIHKRKGDLKKVRESQQVPVVIATPEDEARDAYKQFSHLALEGDVEGYCMALASAVRNYLVRRFGAEEDLSVTAQIVEDIRGLQVPAEIVGLTEKILDLCDLVKFAKHELSHDQEQELRLSFDKLIDVGSTITK